MGFVSLEAEYISTPENLLCVSFPLLTTCVSFLLSAVYALHLLFTLTHLLSKANGCVPGFQSAMEKDGTQRSLASSHNPLLQRNSKSQREAFLQEGKTQTEEPRWAEEEASGLTQELQGLFQPGSRAPQLLSPFAWNCARAWPRGGRSRGKQLPDCG